MPYLRKFISQFYRLSKIARSIILLSFFLLSCTDQGCIEADDFGEYETQTLEVIASANSDLCYYDSSKPMLDSSQGAGIKPCFISGNVTIYDETGASQVSSSGCNGLATVKFQNLCINQCISECNANQNSSNNNSSAEPNWKSSTISIRPNSEIKIRATGSISLGDKYQYPDIFVKSDESLPQSYDEDWNNLILDLTAGKVFNLSFSGQFDDGSSPNGGSTPIGRVGAGSFVANDNSTYNASRRLVGYVIKHPPEYDFDSSQIDEKIGSINIPLLPDENMWECNYNGGDLLQSDCGNKSYRINGYPNANDSLINAEFPVTSNEKSRTLSRYGGMIRWSNDGLVNENEDPFTSISCLDTACAGAGAVDPLRGRIVGDISSSEMIISSPTSSKISFRHLLPNPACNGDIDVVIRSGGVDISTYTVSIINSSWSITHISAEAGQEIVVRPDPKTYNDSTGNATSCGRALAVKFTKYHDIEINESGFVSFAMLNGISGQSCVISARIINPQGSHVDLNSTYKADFYEYAKFGENGDPMNSIVVPALTSATFWDNGVVNNGSAEVFVRKGQKIRFSPESWNGNWDALGGQKQCGIGMAMRIKPRPALLCRGYGDGEITNPDCNFKYENGELIGCEEYAPECLDSSSSFYCPASECLAPVACDDGSQSSSPPFTRSNCSLGSINSSCNIDSGLAYTTSSCNACSNLRLQKALQSPFIAQANTSLCYDLESYRGKVANIPIAGFSESQLADASISKGATTLGTFNGYYGIIGDYKDTGSFDAEFNSNKIFTATKIMSVAESGRLKFMILDGDNFKNISSFYGDNNSSGASYSGTNGFKISLSSYLQFLNGEWLETILCAESSAGSILCRSNTRPDSVPSQPKVVELASPQAGSGSVKPESTTSFKYDDFGDLTRFRPVASGSSECINGLVGDTYYCHTESVLKPDLLRLTFKIKDPEEGNCPLSANSSINDGILIDNSKFVQSNCDVNNPTSTNPAVKNGLISISGGTRSCNPNNDTGKICEPNEQNCTKQFICADKYSNNSGKYIVSIRIKNPEKNISKIVDNVVTPVVEVMDGTKDGTKVGQAERIYKLIVNDARYKAILSMSLIVMVTFYGVTYLMGINDASISELITRIIKIGVIYLFIGPEGWYWFDRIVVSFFKDGTDYISFVMASSFDDSPELKIAIDNYDFYDKSILFGSVDKVLSIIFSDQALKKISGLLFASIFGFVYIIIIIYALIAYIFAISNAILIYLTAQVFISIMFVLGPLFFIFLFFNQTKEMFDKWLQQLIGFSLQQIFLLTTLAFFNMMMYEVVKMSLGYKVCWDEVWTINIITRISLLSWWTIPSIPANIDSQIEVGNIGKNDGIPSLFSILFIWVIAKLMREFIEFMTGVASDIGGGISASTLAGGISSSVAGLGKTVGQAKDSVWKASGGEAAKRIDKKLFSSGEYAKRARAEKRRDNSKTIAQKRALAKAGDKGVHEFKKKYGSELASASPEEQKEMLRKAADAAMNKKGAQLGLRPEEVAKLKSEKGLKYEGENLFGAAKAFVSQGLRKGGTIANSLDDKEYSTELTKSEAKKALKNADKEGRKKMIEGAKDGKIYIKPGSFTSRVANKKPIKAMTNKIKGLGKKIYNKEYEEAASQLVAEGEIAKMKLGSGWTRDDVEKKKIRDRMKENQAKKNSSAAKMTQTSTIASLEGHVEFLEEIESSEEGGAFSKPEGSIFGRKKYERNTGKRDELREKARKDRMNRIKKQYETHAQGAQEEIDSSNSAIQNFQDEIEENKGGEYEEAISLQAQIDDQDTPKEEKQAAQERLKEIQKSEGYKQRTSNITNAQAGIKRAESYREAAMSRKTSAEDKISTIDTFGKIVEGAKAQASVDITQENITPQDIENVKMSQAALERYSKITSGVFDSSTTTRLQEFNDKYSKLQEFAPTAPNDVNPNNEPEA